MKTKIEKLIENYKQDVEYLQKRKEVLREQAQKEIASFNFVGVDRYAKEIQEAETTIKNLWFVIRDLQKLVQE